MILVYQKIIVMLCLIWAGMIIGISFLEAWAKFKAPSMTREIGMDVGRTVFRYFHYAQGILLLVVLALSALAALALKLWIILVAITALFSWQSLTLFPALCQRVTAILKNEQPASSKSHLWYGLVEIGKLILLILVSTLSLK